MEAQRKRNLKSGAAYDPLFPKAAVGMETILTNAGVGDTCTFIPKVVRKTLQQTKAIAEKLKGVNTYDTCRNIWHFVYEHIAYRKDRDGYEQIRSPARTWHDRRQGVDCDCYSTFISSLLTNLNIPHKLRITKYNRDHFQHIYPVVPLAAGKYITLDCVTDKFDYEVPYSEQKDYNMDLQYLNGIEGIATAGLAGMAGYDLDGIDGVLELGKLAKKKKAATAAGGGASKKQTRQTKKAAKKTAGKTGDSNSTPNDPNSVPGSGVKKKKGFKKLVNIVNKANPATLALRNGVLAAMKLNVGKIGSRLRWSFISPNEAAKKGIDPERFKKLVAVRQKLENIFYGAGGKPENLKKAIVNGKGNKDKQVRGLDGLDHEGIAALDYVDMNAPLSIVLGATLYHSENIEGMEGHTDGIGALGEPVTLATVAAASGVIATIAGMLKKVGDIFKGKGEGSGDFSEEANAAAEQEVAETQSGSSNGGGGSSTAVVTTGNGSSGDYSSGSETGSSGGSDRSGNSNTSVAKSAGSPGSEEQEENGVGAGGEDSFWAKHKKWLLPVSIGVGSIAVIAIAMGMKKPSPPQGQNNRAMHGIPRKKNHHRKKANPKQGKKEAVALL